MSCRSFYQVPSLGAEERTFRDIRKIHAYSPLHSYVRYSNSRCESKRKDRSKARRRPGRFWPLGARQSRARTSVVYDAQSAAVSSACRLCYSFFASRYVDLSFPSPLSLSLTLTERSHELDPSSGSFGSLYQCLREFPRGNTFLREVYHGTP